MSARDELALDIFLADNARQPEAEALVDWETALHITAGITYAHGIADGILAAGYSKPRTITTVEERDALREGSVVRDKDGDVIERLWGGWYFGDNNTVPNLPATVIHEPTTEATR